MERSTLVVGGSLAALGALLLFGGSAKAASSSPSTPADPCKPITDQIVKLLPTATVADLPTLQTLLVNAQKLGCTDAVTQIQNTINKINGKKDVTPPSPPSTIVFNPAKAKDPIRANSLAIAISNSPVPPGAPASVKIDSKGTYATFADFCRDAARIGAVPTIMALQDASGISVDGTCGAQTTAAWNYWLTHSTRPDGSTDVRASVSGEKMSVAGEKPCATCGAMTISVGSCCASCAAGKGCDEKAVNPLVFQSVWDQLEFGKARAGFGEDDASSSEQDDTASAVATSVG